LVLTVLFTVPPAVASLAVGALGYGSKCGSPLDLNDWLFVCAALFVTNLLFTFVFWWKCGRPYNVADPNDKDYLARASYIVCHDPGMAVYILVLLLQVCWQIVGHVTFKNAVDSKCTTSTPTMMVASLVLTWIYLALAALMLCSSFLCDVLEKNCCGWLFSSCLGAFLCLCCPGMRDQCMPQPAPQPVTPSGTPSGPPTTGVPLNHTPTPSAAGASSPAAASSAAAGSGALPVQQYDVYRSAAPAAGHTAGFSAAALGGASASAAAYRGGTSQPGGAYSTHGAYPIAGAVSIPVVGGAPGQYAHIPLAPHAGHTGPQGRHAPVLGAAASPLPRGAAIPVAHAVAVPAGAAGAIPMARSVGASK
jgi:hypothetical protein